MKFLSQTFVVAKFALITLLALVAIGMLIDPKHEFTTDVMIAAPPADVWNVLTDEPGFAEWGVFIEGIAGPLVAGQSIKVTLNSASADRMTFEPTVLVMKPNEELRWRGRVALPNVFDGEHWFTLEPTAAGTRVIHGERFDGILVPLFPMDVFKADFERFNAALKARVESLVDTSAAVPTGG